MDYLEFWLMKFQGDLDRDLQNCSRVLSVIEKDVDSEIAKLEKEYKKLGEQFEDKYKFEELYLYEYQEKINDNKMMQYNILAGCMQKLYASFENQMVGYKHIVKKMPESNLNPTINLEKYPFVDETRKTVNVIKHNIGRSYAQLKNENSKFLDEPAIFDNYPVYKSLDIILNIEKKDLDNFIKEAKQVWSDIIQEHNKNKKEKQNTKTENNSVKSKQSNNSKDVSTR